MSPVGLVGLRRSDEVEPEALVLLMSTYKVSEWCTPKCFTSVSTGDFHCFYGFERIRSSSVKIL